MLQRSASDLPGFNPSLRHPRQMFSVPFVVVVFVAIAYMAAPIPRFISLEVGDPFRTP